METGWVYIQGMDDGLRQFLDKFAELERRVRKLAAENRSMKQELESAREEAHEAREEAEAAERMLERERSARQSARDRIGDLIVRLEGLKGGAEESGREKVKESAGEH